MAAGHTTAVELVNVPQVTTTGCGPGGIPGALQVSRVLEVTDSTRHWTVPMVAVHPDAKPVPVTVTLLPPAVLAGAAVLAAVTLSETVTSAGVTVKPVLEVMPPQLTNTASVPAVSAGVVQESEEVAASKAMDEHALAPIVAVQPAAKAVPVITTLEPAAVVTTSPGGEATPVMVGAAAARGREMRRCNGTNGWGLDSAADHSHTVSRYSPNDTLTASIDVLPPQCTNTSMAPTAMGGVVHMI